MGSREVNYMETIIQVAPRRVTGINSETTEAERIPNPILYFVGFGNTKQEAENHWMVCESKGREISSSVNSPMTSDELRRNAGSLAETLKTILDNYPTFKQFPYARETLANSMELLPEKLTLEALRAVSDLERLYAQSGDRKVKIVAHSKGSLVAAIVACLRPKLVHSLELRSPPGLGQEESALAFAKNYFREAKKVKSTGGARVNTHNRMRTDFEKVRHFAENAKLSLQQAFELKRNNSLVYLFVNQLVGCGAIEECTLIFGGEDELFSPDAVVPEVREQLPELRILVEQGADHNFTPINSTVLS